jgi:hypothetical protein
MVQPLSTIPSTTNSHNANVEKRISPSRRQLLSAASSVYITAISTTSSVFAMPLPAIAFGSSNNEDNNNRRQVELCLVAIQRVSYWAEGQALALASASPTTERRKELYLESRLGAKALLTSKIGPGATGVVYTLSTLRLPACLVDLEWHATKELSASAARVVAETKERFTEGLASIVEFDGLETLTDASPRSTLTVAQYTDAKASYVVRALRELVVPSARQLLRSFGPEPLARVQRYMEQYYAAELPPAVAEETSTGS